MRANIHQKRPTMRMTVQEYLALDDASERKWEFYGEPAQDGQIWGDVVAMAGGNRKHSSVGTDLIIRLGAKLDGTGCRVNGPDLRVGHKDETGYNYPDVSVTCGTPEFREDDRELTLTNPTALFEVSSPPTAEYDRGEKVRRYTRLPSVRLYAMLDQERCAATVLRRGEDGSWSMTDIEGPDAAIEVDPPGVTLRLGEVYADLLKRQAASDD